MNEESNRKEDMVNNNEVSGNQEEQKTEETKNETVQEQEQKEEVHQHRDQKKKKGRHEKEQIEELQIKLNESNDKFLRLYAEFENYRKRALNERLELIKTASEEVIREILPIVDDYERALKHIEEATDIAALKEGTELIYNKLKTLLEQKKVEEIKTVGEEFNTDYHEAITTIPAQTEEMKGRVVEEVQKGYILNGKVIRFAKVIVGS